MILGTGGVGKTSFKRSLMMLPWEPNTNSTIISDVETIRPFGYEWQTSLFEGEGMWRKVTRDDELNELAQLLAAVHGSAPSFNLLPDTMRAVSLFSTPNLTPTMSLVGSDVADVEQPTINEWLSEAIKRADHFSPTDIINSKPQPFLHIWDCGGQPVFLEILPAFLTSRTMFLLLFDASQDFRKQWRSVKHIQGRKIPGEVSNVSTLNLMLNWMANIHAHLIQNEKGAICEYPRILCIGTHGDKLQTETRKDEIKEQLKEKCKSKAFGELIVDTFIVDNTTAGKKEHEDPSFHQVRKLIHDFTSKKLLVKTPVSWVLFRKIIQLSKANVLTIEQAQAIGVTCKISHEDVPKVLLFYHQLGVLLFYPHIEGLKNKIIISPKWFVEIMGKVFTLEGGDENDMSLMKKLLHEQGILVRHYYMAAWENNGDLEPDAIMELLVHFCLASEVSTELYSYTNVRQFFLPAVLPSCSHNAIQPQPGYHHRATYLHITFSTKFVPPGFFTRFVTTIAKSQHCTLLFEDKVYRNCITFRFGVPPIDHVILTDLDNAIQVEILRYIPDTSSSMTPFRTNCRALLEVLEKAGNTVDTVLYTPTYFKSSSKLEISKKFQFVCSSDDCQCHQLHYLKVGKGQTTDLPLCCEKNKNYRRPTREEGFWFKEERSEVISKRISQSEMYDISQEVGERADDLAAKLGMLDKLREYRCQQPQSLNPLLNLLLDWDKGCGERHQLVKALNEINLTRLAKTVAGNSNSADSEVLIMQTNDPSGATVSFHNVNVTVGEDIPTESSPAINSDPQAIVITENQCLLTNDDIIKCSRHINENLVELAGYLNVTNAELQNIQESFSGINVHAYQVLCLWHERNREATKQNLQFTLQQLNFIEASRSLETTIDNPPSSDNNRGNDRKCCFL